MKRDYVTVKKNNVLYRLHVHDIKKISKLNKPTFPRLPPYIQNN